MSAFLLVSLYSEQLTGPTSNASKQLTGHLMWSIPKRLEELAQQLTLGDSAFRLLQFD